MEIVKAPKEKEGKVDWSVFPMREAEKAIEGFVYGVIKYGKPFSYRDGTGLLQRDMFAACVRHLRAIQDGELCDKESGCWHWSHIFCNSLMAIAGILRRKELELQEPLWNSVTEEGLTLKQQLIKETKEETLAYFTKESISKCMNDFISKTNKPIKHPTMDEVKRLDERRLGKNSYVK
jgi:hypothetical protein